MPNRIIKENIRTSNKVNKTSDAGFRFWIYLMTYVDDYGRGSADLDILKGFVYPKQVNKTRKNVEDALKELASIGLIRLYEIDGEPFLYFPNWDEHQTVRNKRSKFPAPPDDCMQSATTCKQLQANVPVIQSESESISESVSETNHTAPVARGGRSEAPDYDAIVSLFNSICRGLPSIRDLTDKRKNAIRAAAPRVEEYGGWEKLFKTVQHSDFLTGRSGAWTNCGFDWILKPGNLTKIMEGNYRNADEASGQPPPSYDIEEMERRLWESPPPFEKIKEKSNL